MARHQQYFAVGESVGRVQDKTPEGERHGSVVWHTTGSGKSLTMVMLAQVLTKISDELGWLGGLSGAKR